MRTRLFFPALLGLALLSQFSCASQTQEAKTRIPAPVQNSACLQEQEGDFFRHRVRLVLPGQNAPFVFDGLMFLTEGKSGSDENRRIRLAGLGGMGLRLFSLLIDREALRLEYLHPSLARIPHVEEHIARCVRVLWLSAEVENDSEQVLRSSERPWPRTLVFTQADPKFTVEIHLVEHRHLDANDKEQPTTRQEIGQVQP